MQKFFENYINSISSKFSHPETSEMGYRTDFEILLKGIFEQVQKIPRVDHDARAKQGNKPDFVVLKNDVPILYIEAKDIGVSLDKVEKSEQMARYFGYANLVLTDYVEFRFYRNGLRYEEPIKIAHYDIKARTITPTPENYEHVSKSLIDFTQTQKEPIKSGEHLAKIMGGRAQRIRDNVRHFFTTESNDYVDIKQVYETVKKLLVHDLTSETFADMYAQTLVYGLFVARYYDETPNNFTRQEARDLVPASNPFLGHFFDHISGRNFDKRLAYIVDELCEVFSHADVKELMKQYFKDDLWGKEHMGPDPVIHFYEDFLKEYDPDLRKKMGAYYTPLPVVRFIVRAIDSILEKDFGLARGLADTSKNSAGVHRIQVLDPAVGTGTFISAVIRNIFERIKREKQDATWTSYVHHELLPRIHGFELMMAPYTIAHLKLSMAFKDTGFKYFNNTRLGIYLTNSLEESLPQQELLAFDFGAAIAEEAKKADEIKNKKPIMIVVGNPPYSGSSSNETEYANSLVEKYKVEPGGKQKLQEHKHWLNDDYVKFIALAESLIEKNGDGILGFITNHGYLDNPTFRGMRWHLMNTFDSIYILDLHGNTKKKEVSPDGSKDENVFDIQPGVAIMLGIKNKGVKNQLAKVYHYGLWGKREAKFESLSKLTLKDAPWTELTPRLPGLLLVPEGSSELDKEYRNGFGVNEFFIESTTGVFTLGDSFIIDEKKDVLVERIENFLREEILESAMKAKFDLGKNYAKWVIDNKGGITFQENKIVPITYRPFDSRFTYFDNKLVWRPRTKLMANLLDGSNVALAIGRQGQVVGSMEWNVVFATKNIIDLNCFYRGGEQVYPLYINSSDGSKIPNFNKEIIGDVEKIVGKMTSEDIFDYIYATLHSPSYREKYKQFLKIDFPRIPYPNDKKTFGKLVELGRELRGLHLLETPKVNQLITTYQISGSDIVEKPVYKDGNVYINKEQYFGDVPEVAWNFYIGGYQPAQKWLKDRKGRTLNNDDIEHYQKMIVALTETDRIMKEIDGIKEQGAASVNE
ncbi:MAG: type ISP restriction/modification enzyme [bacterium]|nr:type ISP restriction/modification enzyme [bacterium]